MRINKINDKVTSRNKVIYVNYCRTYPTDCIYGKYEK